MRKFTLCFVLFFLGATSFVGQTAVILDSTRLPIVAMKLPYLWPPWDPIPDTPKVSVAMGIVDNGYNVMNHIPDPKNGYLGMIGIEKRGSISQAFWYLQKSYGFETRMYSGGDSDVVILGMPKEHDWILYGPYDDRSFMRNTLMYQLGRELNHWTPNTRYCEVQFYDWAWAPDYRGLYVMMEKIKRDKKRVNIAKLDTDDNAGDSLTGGYIFAVDKNIWAQDSGWKSPKDTGVFFSYKYPKSDEITIQQKNYLKAYVDSFETALQGPNFKDPLIGYNKYIDRASFIDFFFMQEVSKSIDAYRRSAYMYKDKNSKGGKINAGPIWDFNSALGGPKICTFEQDTGWAYKTVCSLTASYHIPFWWGRFLEDSVYARDLKCRWLQLRQTVLDTAHIFRLMDSMRIYINESAVRHFAKYSITNTTLKNQVDSLKLWITGRLNWLDANMPGVCSFTGVHENEFIENSLKVFPNPTAGKLSISFYLPEQQKMNMELVDMYGRTLLLSEKQLNGGNNTLQMDIGNHASGIYFLKLSGDGKMYTRKIVLQE